MDFTLNEYEINLKKRYEEIFSDPKNVPTWAFRKIKKEGYIHPAIPLVGNNYGKGFPKVLIYGSAENLNYLRNEKNSWLDENETAIKRSRIVYEQEEKQRYFPNVHINPISTGKLLFCAYYMLTRIENIPENFTPKEFLENIAVANFGKYTAQDGKDYANNYEKLEMSLPYIKADLEELKPKYLIMTDSTYKIPKIVSAIKETVPDIIFLPVMQMNQRNINRMHKNTARYPEAEPIGIFLDWYNKLLAENGSPLTGKNKTNCKSLFNYCNRILENQEIPLFRDKIEK